jgi:WhiB family redox-sensing transcriptional regulator
MSDVTRLPQPVVEQWDWQLYGACRGFDSTLFFHPDGERGPARERREARAKSICLSCPVLEECREHALSVQESYGIWGGMGEGERRALIAARRHRQRVRLAAG